MLLQCFDTADYFAAGRWAKYCNQHVCLSVSLSVHSTILKNTCQNFTKCSVVVAVAWSYSADSAIRYVHPVLWMTVFSHNWPMG